MKVLEQYNIKEVSLAIFAILIELRFQKEEYNFNEIKDYILELIESGRLYSTLQNIAFLFDDISIYDILDYVLGDLNGFILDLLIYLNNKNNTNVLFLTNYVIPYIDNPIGYNDVNADISDTDVSLENYINFENISYSDLRFNYIIHKHDAKKAGTHYDLRIEIKKDKVISIAFRHYPLIKDKAMGIIQPIHESYWMTFKGEIKEGYGAGKLTIIDKGVADFYKTEKGTLVLVLYSVLNDRYYQYAIIPNNNLLFIKTDKIDLFKIKNKQEILDFFY